MRPGDGASPAPCEHGFVDLCLGETHSLEFKRRDVRQFVGRNHAIHDGRAVGFERLAGGVE